MSEQQRFAALRVARRIWAVGAIHGEVGKISELHSLLASRLLRGDRIVYLGNMMGRGEEVLRTFDELVAYRCYFLARFQGRAEDIVFLRGAQEEMWQKLLQLQFAPAPEEVLTWMLEQGVGKTLEAYGFSAKEGLDLARGGAIEITKWTNSLRRTMKCQAGHYELFTSLKRAAFDCPLDREDRESLGPAAACQLAGFPPPGKLLFVNAGLDPQLPLERQKDNFWWAGHGFNRIQHPYGPFERVIRGFDPQGLGYEETAHSVTLDGRCGFPAGKLHAACFLPNGEIVERLEAS